MGSKPTYDELTKRIKELEQEVNLAKKTERQLHKSEILLNSIIHQSPHSIWISDDKGTLIELNPACCRLLKITREEVVGKYNILKDNIVEEQGYLPLVKSVFEEGKTIRFIIEYESSRLKNIKLRERSYVILDVTIFPIKNKRGDVTNAVVQHTDITKHSQAEKGLKESERRFRELAESMPETVFEMDLNGLITFTNDYAFDQFGYSVEDFKRGVNAFDMIIEQDRQRALDNIQKILRGDHVGLIEYSLQKKNGETFPAIIRSSLISRDGKPAGMRGLVIDITERKKAEEALRESEERYRRLFEMESDAIFMIENETGNILEVNIAASAIFGYTREEFRKMKNIDLSAEPDETRKAIENRRTTIPIRYCRKKDGSIFPVEITSTHFQLQGRDVHIAAMRDITFRIKAEKEKLELESRLQQAQKMEAIGTLAGGIAHDFNNILTPIMIHSEMAIMDLSPDDPVQRSLKQIFKAGERARALVKQILTFARKQQGERAPIEMSRVLKESVKLLRSTIPSTIDIHYNVDTDNDTVNADPTQLSQIIMNLCTNAAHAMEEKGGILEISLTNEVLDSVRVRVFNDVEPGHYVKLTVRDTGHGIEPHLIDKIFEPYFTTKEVEKGTGLGLALVHGIVKSYKGAIIVESEVGKGTTFHVYIPLIEGGPEILETRPDSKQLPVGNERILFVDDEKSAIDAIQPLLEILGYKVTARTSSIEALEAFRNNPYAFDIVITDMTMPNMTGKELVQKIMSIRSDIPVILCTGYSEKIDEKKASEMGIGAFVMKPIIARDMAIIIRNVLNDK